MPNTHRLSSSTHATRCTVLLFVVASAAGCYLNLPVRGPLAEAPARHADVARPAVPLRLRLPPPRASGTPRGHHPRTARCAQRLSTSQVAAVRQCRRRPRRGTCATRCHPHAARHGRGQHTCAACGGRTAPPRRPARSSPRGRGARFERSQRPPDRVCALRRDESKVHKMPAARRAARRHARQQQGGSAAR